jgi:hypothetical protein
MSTVTVIEIKPDFVTVCGKSYWRITRYEKLTREAYEVNEGTTWHAVYPKRELHWQTLTWYNIEQYPALADAVDAWMASRGQVI